MTEYITEMRQMIIPAARNALREAKIDKRDLIDSYKAIAKDAPNFDPELVQLWVSLHNLVKCLQPIVDPHILLGELL